MPVLEAKLLENAFHQFSKASDSIINHYNLLESQIRELKREVEEKNSELQRAQEYLYNILNSLPVGVVVSEKKNVLFSNDRARKLGSEDFLQNLNNGVNKVGELKNGKGHFRWERETLLNGFEGKEVIVFEDVTEVEKMKERLERDERLMAMGEMAARMAHEIKNPLGSMELFLSILLNGKLKKKEREYVDYALFGLKTIDRIINNLLTYTKPKTLALKRERMNKIVKETLDFMSLSMTSRDIELTFNTYFDGITLFDPDLMKLVVMNFVSNAIEALADKNGAITVVIKEEGKYVVVGVSDNGMGMSEEVKKNMFNPFFTTKDKGVGLGLFIVYNIVKAHGGYIEVESVEGFGSTFLICIPKDGKDENECAGRR
jgi:signal transduction histidine kinase